MLRKIALLLAGLIVTAPLYACPAEFSNKQAISIDQLLDKIIVEELSNDEIIKQGFDATEVNDTIRRIYRNEYKRRQAPIGIRISTHAFGKDRRYPITMGSD